MAITGKDLGPIIATVKYLSQFKCFLCSQRKEILVPNSKFKR